MTPNETANVTPNETANVMHMNSSLVAKTKKGHFLYTITPNLRIKMVSVLHFGPFQGPKRPF